MNPRSNWPPDEGQRLTSALGLGLPTAREWVGDGDFWAARCVRAV